MQHGVEKHGERDPTMSKLMHLHLRVLCRQHLNNRGDADAITPDGFPRQLLDHVLDKFQKSFGCAREMVIVEGRVDEALVLQPLQRLSYLKTFESGYVGAQSPGSV